ncbi:hypothetical protein HPDP_00442 [Candidatus Hepatincola sp. Pdp]
MYNFLGRGLKNFLLIIVLLIIALLIIVIGNTNKLYAFTQDRTFVFTPSVGGYYTNNSSDHFLPDLAIDATYVLSDNLEAGIGLAIQKTNLHATNADQLPSLSCPECLNDDSVVVPLYVILKSNIILNYKESISFYGKLGAVLDSETHVNVNDANIVYEPNAYVAVGVDYVYKNIVFGVVYKAINVRERLEKIPVGIEKNTIDSNYFNNYFGLRLGYNIYTVITPATE